GMVRGPRLSSKTWRSDLQGTAVSQSQSGLDLPPVETSAGLRLRRAYGSERSRCHFCQARGLERRSLSVWVAEKRGERRFLNRRFVWSAVWLPARRAYS